MSQTTSGVTFSNATSGSNELYIATSPGSEWAAVLLPEGSTYNDSTIDLNTAMQNQVYFLFAQTGPGTGNAQAFITKYRPYLAAFRNSSFDGNVTIAWLNCPKDITAVSNTPITTNPPPNPDNTYVLNIFQTGTNFFTSQTFQIVSGNQFGSFQITSNTQVIPVISENQSCFQLVLTAAPLNLKFANVGTTAGTNSIVTSNISIPLSGPGTGSMRFGLNLNLSLDFTGYGLQNRYYFNNNNNQLQTLNYNLFVNGGNPNEFVVTQAEIDFLDTGNARGLNTYFAITNTIFNNQTNATRNTSFPSYLAISTGFQVTLWPDTSLLTNSQDQINNIFPGPNSARFVVCPQDSAETLKFYMVPEGDFFIDPGSKPANADGQYDLLLGLSGTEISTFTPFSAGATADKIRYISRQNAFATKYPTQPVSLADPGTPTLTLDSTYLTAWANVISTNQNSAQYGSQPKGASLFAKGHGLAAPGSNITGFLGHFEPSISMPQSDGFCFPMVPYLGLPVLQQPITNLNDFESQIISKERKAQIANTPTTSFVSKSRALRFQAVTTSLTAPNYTASATPQGLIANVTNDSGTWSGLYLSQNIATPGNPTPTQLPEYVYPANITPPSDPTKYQLSFVNIQDQLKSAFLTNQQFLVVTNNQFLGQLYSKSGLTGGSSTSNPVFNNKMSIEGWPFDINVGENQTFADYNNVIIFKFCQGTLIDRVKNPNTWTQADQFSVADPNGTGPDNHTQLVATSFWLQSYLDAAEKSYERELKTNAGGTNYYEKFHTIINSPTWNGILVLKANIDLQEFPQQLKGMICGINLNNFFAHHIGIEVNRIDATDIVTMENVSSMFGLINYVDPSYAAQIASGMNVNTPILPTAGSTYDFKVLSLQILFKNTAISDFSSKVQLTMNNLFSDTVINTNNKYGAGDLNSIVLDGTYQDHNGTPVYVFANNDDNIFFFNNNLLENVEITEIQFNTLTTDPDATLIQSRFLMWGYLNFGQMSGENYTLDAFSFGNPDNNNVVSKGLYYSNLYVNMSFDLSNPTVVTYGFDAAQIAFNSSLSNTRATSLYPNFALQINNLVSGNSDTPPSSMGYLPLSLPNISTSSLTGDWFGLQMTLNMGTPGELAGNLGFNSTLLIAWSPTNGSVTPSYTAFVGIKLPGTSSNAKLISLQGLLKLSIDKLTLQYIPNSSDSTLPGSYLLTLSKIALKFLGLLKLPPGGNTNFLLFGNPNPDATSKSLGWYASYNKSKN